MKNAAFEICNEKVHPGESASFALPLPELFSCAPLYMPIKITNGKKAGPRLLITAAMHGNELNGTEIINRLLNMNILKNIRGTIITIPTLNVHGFINRSRHLPGNIDLNSCFPGSASGSHAARVAHTFTDNIFNHIDVCIDLQTGFINYSNLPQIYASLANDETKRLAAAFNAPVISDIEPSKGSLALLSLEQNKPFLCYEAGEAMRFDEHSIKTGVKGIINVMRALDMLPEKGQRKESPLKSFTAQKNIWVHASTSGISYSKIKLGQHIKKGDALATIKDPFGAGDDVIITSPEEGIIVGKNNLPLVHEGEGIFQLAIFQKMAHAANHLEEWKEKSTAHFKEDMSSK